MEGVLDVVDEFLRRSGDRDWCARVKTGYPGGPGQPDFEHMRTRAGELQEHLETIFFEWEPVAKRSLRTLVF